MGYNPSVWAIVLNWNQAELTHRCVQHIAAQTYQNIQMLIVDNGSDSAVQVQLTDQYPTSAHILQLPRNEGFSGGMNKGIRIALDHGADYIWAVNNDAFPAPDCLARLVSVASTTVKIAAITPALYSRDGTEQFCWATINWRKLESETYMSSDQFEAQTGTWISGAAMLIRAEAIREIGHFDSRFFAYMEDVDWCVRAQAAGYQIGIAKEARCVHLVSASTGGVCSPLSLYLMTRNSWIFYKRRTCLRHQIHRVGVMIAKTLAAVYGDFHCGRILHAEARLAALVAGAVGEVGKPVRFGRWSRLTGWFARIVGRFPYFVLAGLQSRAEALFPERVCHTSQLHSEHGEL